MPTSDTSSDGENRSLISETVKSDLTWNFFTDFPAGVMTMFFLTRYMSMSGLMRR